MTIQDLAEQAGVTERTIRYYVGEGLLPPPEYGKPARYTTEHLDRLLLIKALQERSYMPLSAIKQTLDGLDHSQVRALLDQATEGSQVPTRGALAPTSPAAPPEQLTYGPPSAPAASAPPYREDHRALKRRELEEGHGPRNSALDYIAKVLRSGAQPVRPARPSARQAQPHYTPPAPPTTQAPLPGTDYVVPPPGASPQEEARTQLREQPAGYAQPTPEEWLRVTLAPGIELHYAARSDPGFRARVQRVIRAALDALQGGAG